MTAKNTRINRVQNINKTRYNASMTATNNVSPWGSRPVPVLPRWYLETLSDTPLPDDVKEMNTEALTIGDLDRFWDSAQPEVDASVLTQSVTGCVNNVLPPSGLVVIPATVDGDWLLKSPLRPRTLNSIATSGLLEQTGPITVENLMSVKNFGISSLLDVMCVIESAQHSISYHDPSDTELNVAAIDENLAAWDEMLAPFQLVISTARDFFGAGTLGEVFDLDVAWLTKTVGVAETINKIPIASLADDRGIRSDYLAAVKSFFAGLSEPELLIFNEAVLADKPSTYRAMGAELGVTGEAARRRTIRLNDRLEAAIGAHLDTLSALFRRLLGPVVDVGVIDGALKDVLGREPLSTVIAVPLLRKRLGYSAYGDIWLSPEAKLEADNLKASAKKIADDVGIVDETELQRSLSDSRWLDHWDTLTACAGLIRVLGQIAVKHSKKAAVKAALMLLGRPATKTEIASLTDIDAYRMSNYLYSIPSVARAAKQSWGLSEQIDYPYEGIATGIANLIKESGGTAPLGWVISEMTRRFGANDKSVRAYAESSQFVTENNFIRLAEESDIKLRDLDETITGRDERGYPYWSFSVREPYFRGYSLDMLPPEIASELGCGPNDRITAEVSHPAGAGDITVSWQLSSFRGAIVGKLSDPLRRLGAEAGMNARIVVLGPRLVEMRLE